MFIDSKVTSTYLGGEVMKIRAGDVFAIDIAMVPTLEEQAFIVGDVMKNIDEMYSSRAAVMDGKDRESRGKEEEEEDSNGDGCRGRAAKPRYILIFIDEINRFMPKLQSNVSGGRMSPVAEQIMRTVIAGRSRGTVLFSAQQFRSTVDPALYENTGMHVSAKIGLSELMTQPYSMIDEGTKMNIARLNKGELVMVHPAFRHPVRIVFPKAAFRK